MKPVKVIIGFVPIAAFLQSVRYTKTTVATAHETATAHDLAGRSAA